MLPPSDAASLLDAAPVPLLHVGPSGTLLHLNAAARALLGPAVARGQPLATLWPGAEGAAHGAALCAAATVRLALPLPGVAGGVHASSQPLAAGGWMLALQPAPAQSELESQLALAVDLAKLVVWRHDLDSGRVHYNDQGWRLIGRRPRAEGVPLAEVRALMHPDDLPQVHDSVDEAMASHRPIDAEVRLRHTDGSWRHVLSRRVALRDAAGRPVAQIGVGLDITERRLASLALRGANERAALAARGAGMGTWEVDLVSGEAFWDTQMWLLRGLPPRPQALSAAEREAIVHPEDRQRVAAALSQALLAGESLEQEFRVVWPDGSVRWLASRSVELRDAATGARRRIGVNWDVTDQRTAEAVRRERELARRESQAKSQFLARMSHELRTPLNAVLGFSQLLLSAEHGADGSADARRRQLGHIRAAGQHLLSLINDVLDLSSLQGGEMRIALQPVALAPLVAQTLPLLGSAAAEAGVSIVSGDLPGHVLADATRLRQGLLNLISNAIKYNRAGGQVLVESQLAGAEVRLRVHDTGLGMSQAQLRQLFEPFNRLGREGEAGGVEGTGIGLAIVKALVEAMGGSVHVESTPESGSVFELRLRSASALSARPAVDAADDPPRAGGPAAGTHAAASRLPRRTVLYVEDNPINALIISELLTRRPDIALHVAVDGDSGVAQAEALRPDLVLLDMQLPDFDGFEVLRRLRARPATAAIPCIALSANAMPADIERALAAGMSDYWTKPLDFKAFMAALDTMFGPGPGPGA
jgi:PAS domain S-box-containing protein